MNFERILIVGQGSIGKLHKGVVESILPHSTIKTLSYRRHAVVEKNKTADFYTIEDALKFNPEISIIANPSPYHYEAAMPLIKHGSHVLIEKPIATNVLDAAALISESVKNKIILLTGYNLRHHLALVEFKRAIDSGVLGSIYYANCSVGQNLVGWRSGVDYRNTVSAKKDMGGGVLLELSHEFDYLEWIFGSPVKLFCAASKKSSLEIDVEDSASIILTYKDNFFINVVMDFIRCDTKRAIEVVGSRGTITLDLISGVVKFYGENNLGGEIKFDNRGQREDTYVRQFKHFLKLIQEKNYFMNEVNSGINALKVVVNAKESAAHNKIIIAG